MNTKDITTENLKLRVMVYGKSGTGKTTFAGTFPKPYFFDFNMGMLSLRGKDIVYDTFVDEDLAHPTAYRRFLKRVDEVKDEKFETVVVDDFPSMCECMMRNIQMTNGTLEKTPNLHEWQLLVRRGEEAFHRFKLLGFNVVFIALEKVLTDEVTGEIKNIPLIMGKALPERSPGWFDEVFRAQVDRDKEGKAVYHLLTTAARRYEAKSRLAGMSHCFSELETPDYKVLMNKIKEEGDGKG